MHLYVRACALANMPLKKKYFSISLCLKNQHMILILMTEQVTERIRIKVVMSAPSTGHVYITHKLGVSPYNK